MNIYLFNSINYLAGKNIVLDNIMIFLARYLIWIAPLFLLYLWFRKSADSGYKKLSLFILVSVLLSLLISWSVSLCYFHPRPFMIGLGTKLITRSPDSSFPSDHATIMFAVALATLFWKRYRMGILFLLLALAVGLARVFCGIHFPFDLVGAFLVAGLGTTLVYTIGKYFIGGNKYKNILQN